MRKVKMDAKTVFNMEVIEKLLTDHEEEKNRILKLKRYYNNENDIFNRNYTDKNKPQNKLAHNYAAYITDNFVGYMVGQPVSYKSENQDFLKLLNDIFLYNDEIDNNTTLAQEQSICGYAVELMYRDEKADIRFKCVDTENMIVVYDNTLDENIIFAIMLSKLSDDTYEISTFDKYYEARYEYKEKKLSLKKEPNEHFFNDVPVIVYENNRQCRGDFEKVISLIDAIDRANSDTANDFEYFTNALLVISGVLMEEQDEEGRPLNFKDNRVLNFADVNSKAEYLIKNINDTALENFKNRLNSDIHKFASVPDMSDEKFAGNLSGISIKYKLNSMENVTSIKESKFRKGLMRRIELIVNHLKVKNGKDYYYLDIVPVFTRNIPANDVETVNMVRSLNGIVSQETLLSQLPFVEDVHKEIKQINKEKEEALENVDYDFDDNIDDKTDDKIIEKHEQSKEVVENER